jgi:formylglycine-generating enzyme required for sulfatase activity
MMGALSNDSSAFEDEKPLHEVKIEKSFYLSKYPLTQNQWLTIMGTNPSWFTGCGTCPVENISFLDVQRFISILKQRSAKVYRLPTEEEWEYAAKGGKQSSNYKFAGSNIIEEVAWFEGKSNRKTNPVGAKKSNELGFHDMSGNVMEWCDTIYKSYSRTKNESKNHEEISVVIRGGSWNNHPIACRVTNRFNRPPDYKQNTLGFRLVLEV